MKNMKTNKMKNNIVILGEWDGLPIWRYKTAEEKLQDAGIKVETAKLFIGLEENYISRINEQNNEL